jgi:CheY-like chemotaxis protein
LGHGTGLGLSTVYGIVKAHSGHISCYSEIGTGTTFRLYFPADESDPLPQAAPEEPVDAPGGSETVLVVDDEAAIVETATVILEARGYRVLTADRGESALEVFRANRGVDLVLLDLGMQGMGGRRCLKHLLNIDPQLRVLIASGYSVNGQVRYAVDEGAVGFIGKPYRMSDLLSAVRRALDQPLAARAG